MPSGLIQRTSRRKPRSPTSIPRTRLQVNGPVTHGLLLAQYASSVLRPEAGQPLPFWAQLFLY
jgi:hypothetical protein